LSSLDLGISSRDTKSAHHQIVLLGIEKAAAKVAQQSLETSSSLLQWKLRLFMDALIPG
jgi:hypothetical protein